MNAHESRLTQRYRLALAGCCVLLLLALVPPALLPDASTGLWLMQSVPLVLLLPGLARERRRNLQWLGFVLLFILTLGILQCFAADSRYRLLGLLNATGSVVLFIVAITTIRLDYRTSQGTAP